MHGRMYVRPYIQYVHTYTCSSLLHFLLFLIHRFADLNSSIVQPLIQMNRPQVDSLINGILSINDSESTSRELVLSVVCNHLRTHALMSVE